MVFLHSYHGQYPSVVKSYTSTPLSEFLGVLFAGFLSRLLGFFWSESGGGRCHRRLLCFFQLSVYSHGYHCRRSFPVLYGQQEHRTWTSAWPLVSARAMAFTQHGLRLQSGHGHQPVFRCSRDHRHLGGLWWEHRLWTATHSQGPQLQQDHRLRHGHTDHRHQHGLLVVEKRLNHVDVWTSLFLPLSHHPIINSFAVGLWKLQAVTQRIIFVHTVLHPNTHCQESLVCLKISGL